jgi:hypothetical protein
VATHFIASLLLLYILCRPYGAYSVHTYNQVASPCFRAWRGKAAVAATGRASAGTRRACRHLYVHSCR